MTTASQQVVSRASISRATASHPSGSPERMAAKVTVSIRNVPVDITAAPRAVLSTAADLLFIVGRSVLGEGRMTTARDNAWQAVCADRERARKRAEVQRILSR